MPSTGPHHATGGAQALVIQGDRHAQVRSGGEQLPDQAGRPSRLPALSRQCRKRLLHAPTLTISPPSLASHQPALPCAQKLQQSDVSDAALEQRKVAANLAMQIELMQNAFTTLASAVMEELGACWGPVLGFSAHCEQQRPQSSALVTDSQ